MARFHIDDAGRQRVLEAVTAAEAGTDAEIVTVIAHRSDPYHDAAQQYAFVAALLVPAVVALDADQVLGWLGNGWQVVPVGRLVLAILIAQAAVWLLALLALRSMPLRIALVPGSTKTRRVRRRAIETFRIGAEERTKERVGVLLYVSVSERRAELIADEAVHRAVPAERWGAAMAALVAEVRQGRAADGMAAAVTQVGAILSEGFAKTAADTNELPDRLIEL